jgi:hypothetical protein
VDFRRRAGYFAAAVLLVFFSRILAAEPVAIWDLPAIVVRVDNLVGVLPDDLQFAEGRASEVLARIGARIRWIDEEESVSQHITPSFTVVVENAEGKGASLLIDALGVAHPGVRRAYVVL